MSTNWTSPKTNIFAATNDLRKCLASGLNARLVKMRNEDCQNPIRIKHGVNKDFRNYNFSTGHGSSVNKIKADPLMTEFEKYLSLNYVSVFGSEEAMKRYYETGVIGADNLKSAGRNHLVKVDDLIKFLEDQKDFERANMYKLQYRAPEHVHDVVHHFDFFRCNHENKYDVKQFKHKLWVVELLKSDSEQPRIPVTIRILMSIITALVYPLKYVPRKSVLRMPAYTNYTFRIGDVINGFSIEFQIPKKFSFK